jgi:hypothetical protein
MFEQAKNMMDNAISHNDALSQIEGQRAPQRPWRRALNIGLLVAAIGVFIVFLMSR